MIRRIALPSLVLLALVSIGISRWLGASEGASET
jgi:hypothetical protein